MLASITPLGERGRNQRWPLTVGAHVVGGALGGAATGVLLAAAGQLVPGSSTARLLALAAIVVAGTLLELLLGGRRLSPHTRQVDESWLRRYRGWVYGLGFGAQLGTGAATIVTTSSVYAMLASLLLAPSLTWGLLIGLTFGTVRGAVPTLTAGIRTPRQLARFHQTLTALDRRAGLATVSLQVGIAAAALLSAA